MIQPLLGRSGHADCHCWAPRFDLDEFARVYVPDQLRCRIVVLDSAGNEVTSFGRYGNADDDAGPDVPLADPRTVVVSHHTAYVGDMINNYVARAKLDYRQRASCSFRAPGRKLAELAAELARRGNAAGARRARRALAARKRLAEVEAEAVKLSPSLADDLDWRAVEEAALRQRSTAEVTADDARAALVLTACRDLENWPPKEAGALLAEYAKPSRSPRLRTAIAWALCDGKLAETGRRALYGLLGDDDQRVRLAATYALLDRGDPKGIDQVFSGLLAEDRDVLEVAETTFRKKVLSEDPQHPLAGKVDGRPLAPAFAMDEAAVKALARLWHKIAGKKGHWYLRSATLYLLALSGREEAVPPLLHALRLPEPQRNLNRAIAGLGLHRAREAVPDILKYLARGRSPLWGTSAWNGDKAEYHASVALARIGDPQSVGPVIELLDSPKKVVGPLARRTLTDMFASGVPADSCLVPREGKLVQVRLDRLPSPAELKAAWQEFWKANADKYEWNPKASQLKPKDP
jgi:HEAT repeat protein